MVDSLSQYITEWAHRIADYARTEGLDFYDTFFEILDAEGVNQVAAYGGFPQRYPHWHFGMEYERLQAAHLWVGPNL